MKKVNLEFYGVRFNNHERNIINKFIDRIVFCDLVTIHKTFSGKIELYTYQNGKNNLSYDTCTDFKNKDFLIGYLHAVNETTSGNIYTI